MNRNRTQPSATLNAVFLDTHPLSPVQRAFRSSWAAGSRAGIRFVDTETVCFRVREGGAGRHTIVLFADGPNTIEHHDPVFDRLARWAHVVALDPPGFGFSTPKPCFDFSLVAYTEAYVHLLTALALKDAVVCPTCINVYPCALIAAARPEFISHLVLMQALEWHQEGAWVSRSIDPTGKFSTPYAGQNLNYATRAAMAARWYPNALGDACRSDAFLRQARAGFDHGGIFCLASLIQAWFAAGSAVPEFPPFKQPALAVWGMDDRSHRGSDKASLLAIAPRATLIEREGVGHFPEIEDPEWFESTLAGFLRGG